MALLSVPPTTAVCTKLIDATTQGTVYVGTALRGASQSASVWNITKTTYNSAGARTSKLSAANVTWTGRASHTYT